MTRLQAFCGWHMRNNGHLESAEARASNKDAAQLRVVWCGRGDDVNGAIGFEQDDGVLNYG